ncbi:MAG: hypothetical protein PVG50_00435 [Thiohalophilus sp.]|jgi:hypothetical protein
MAIDDPKLCGYLDRLCNRGCGVVRDTIQQLEAKQHVPELAELSHNEQQRLLQELKSIMAVYDARPITEGISTSRLTDPRTPGNAD